MEDVKIFEKFYDFYTKDKSIDEFKKYVIKDLISYVNGDNEEEIVKNARTSKQSEFKDYISLCYEGVSNSLIRELLKSNIDEFQNVKNEITNQIINGNVNDIDKILSYEIRFYNSIDQSRLIDVLLDNYVKNVKLNNKSELSNEIEVILDDYYLDVVGRINRTIEENKINL